MVELSEVFEKYLTGELIAEELKESIQDAEQVAIELKSLKERVSRMGEVNLSAIEEYEQVKTRYEFLLAQQKDLLAAKEQLQEVIEKINDICAVKFAETFELVNERFVKVFPALFGGGEARLSLVDLPEKGEMGIDIIAQPPGKKMQNISLLSGGEKALTAVCLIFSIFLVKPSPYCLLDEVDAPLDDANVFRFNELVKEMAKRSQIILVTHNKYTMEIAGRLYGVTMQEKGVSKMVSVNLSEVS
jgi:chromosome segregation protein